MTDAFLSIQNLVFGFPRSRFRLRIPALEIEAKSQVACVGPSGCGKSTLIGVITGLFRPQSGTVTCDGRDVSAAPDRERRRWRRRRVGLVFQEFELLDHLTVQENILLPPLLAGDRITPALRDRARALADRAGLSGLERRKPRRLSHGERQRVAVCRALILSPPLLVCDEPTGSLDPRTAASIMDLIQDEATDGGHTLLVVTHDHSLLGRFAGVIDLAENVT